MIGVGSVVVFVWWLFGVSGACLFCIYLLFVVFCFLLLLRHSYCFGGVSLMTTACWNVVVQVSVCGV